MAVNALAHGRHRGDEGFLYFIPFLLKFEIHTRRHARSDVIGRLVNSYGHGVGGCHGAEPNFVHRSSKMAGWAKQKNGWSLFALFLFGK